MSHKFKIIKTVDRKSTVRLLTNPVRRHRVCQIIQRLNLKQKGMRALRSAFRTNRGISPIAIGDLDAVQDLRPFEKGRSKLLCILSAQDLCQQTDGRRISARNVCSSIFAEVRLRHAARINPLAYGKLPLRRRPRYIRGELAWRYRIRSRIR